MAYNSGDKISNSTLRDLEEVIRTAIHSNGGFGGLGTATSGGSYGSGATGGGYTGGGSQGYANSVRDLIQKRQLNKEKLLYAKDLAEALREGKTDEEAAEQANARQAERMDKRAKATAAASIGREIGRKIADIGREIMDVYLAWYNFEQKTSLAHNKMMHTLVLNKMNNYSKILSNATRGSVGSYFGGSITDSANASAQLGIEAINSIIDMQTTKFQQETDFYAQKISGQMQAENKTIMAAAGALGALAGAVAAIPAVGWAAAAVFGVISGAITGIGSMITSFREANLNAAIEKAQEFNKFIIDSTKEGMKDMQDAMDPYLKMTDELSKKILNMGTTIMKAVGEFNYGTENIEKYKDALFGINIEISKFGKTIEDFAKIQSTYSEGTGRAINLSGRDANNIFATARLFGLDEGTTAQMYSDMNIFNMSIEDGSDMLTLMYKKVSNMGLSTRRFGKDLAKNMKLAEKYDFKNGVKGMAEMAMWAQKTRFNMDNLPAALDKVQQGGIEDLLSNSAQLQVLGGNFAMYSDPMAMAYEAFNDPDAYAKRLTEMTKGMGYFDKSIGATRFSQSDIIRLQAYAKAAGLDYTDVRKQINEQQKQSEVMRTLRGSGWSDEQKSLLSSKAQWDMDEKTWKVSVMQRNAQGQYEYVSKKLSEIGAGDIKNLVPEDKQDQLIDIATRQLSVEEKQLAATLASSGRLEARNYGVAETEGKERINIQNTYAEAMEQRLSDLFEKQEKIKTGNYKNQQEFALAVLNSQTGLISAYIESQQQYLANFNENMQTYINDLRMLINDINENKGIGSIAANLLYKSKKGELDKDAIKQAISTIAVNLQGGNFEGLVDESGHVRKEFLENKQLKAIFMTAMSDAFNLEGNTFATELENSNLNLSKYVFKKDKENGTGIYLDGKNQVINTDDFTYDYEEYLKAIRYTNDGIISPNGSPHLISINDGFVQTHPNDTVLAAKPGGPFDTLFDGIFGMVKEIHSALSGNANGNINVNVNGGIDLKANGMDVENLRNNEILKRAITEVVLENMSNKVNGGKNDMWKTNFRQ